MHAQIPVAPLLVAGLMMATPACGDDEEPSEETATDGLTGSDPPGGTVGGTFGGTVGGTFGDTFGTVGDTFGTVGDTSGGSSGAGSTGVPPATDTGGGNPDDVPDIAYCEEVRVWQAWFVARELEILDMVNEVRAQGANCGSAGTFGAAGPLTMHTALRCSARKHSKDMNDRNFFSHTNPSGEGPGDRMEQAGFSGLGGENIAGGRDTSEGTMEDWMGSDGHCSNIMNPDYTVLGVGVYPGEDGPYRVLWTQNFGR